MKWFSPTYLLTHLLLVQNAASGTLPQKPQRPGGALALPPAEPAAFMGPAFYPAAPPVGTAPAAAFTQPAARRGGFIGKALTAEERKYLCFSVKEGVGKYMDYLAGESFDNRSINMHGLHPGSDDFARRFKIIYAEGRKAQFFAAETLDAAFAAEDDAIHDGGNPGLSAGSPRSSAWWNDWNRSREKQQAERDVRSFEQSREYADHFFGWLQQVRRYIHESFSSNITPAEEVRVKRRIDRVLYQAARKARDSMTDAGIPRSFYPDAEVLRATMQAFLARLRREAASLARTPRLPAAETARLNRAIGDINRFYSSNNTQVMGTAYSRTIPNLPELELLASGVVTYRGPHALDNALRYAPHAHRHSDPTVSSRWKYGAQIFVDADKHNAMPIKRLRYENPDMSIHVPYAKYRELEIRGGQYRIDSGPWTLHPYREENVLEQAKYLRLAFLVKQSKQRIAQIRIHDEDHRERDFTGDSWFKPIAMLLGLGSERRTPPG